MDNPLHPEDLNTRKPKGLQVFSGVLRFLSNLINLTEEEEVSAGIYLGSQYDNIDNNMNDKENLK